MADFDIDSSIAALEKSIQSSPSLPAAATNSISSLTPSSSASSFNSSFFNKTLLKQAVISFVLALATVAGFRPVYLCKLEFDEKEGKCKASLLLIKSAIAVLALTLVYLGCIIVIPKFM
jgi:hypothetical protein